MPTPKRPRGKAAPEAELAAQVDDHDPIVPLTEKQLVVVNLAVEGKQSVLLSGGAGTGKSAIVREIRRRLDPSTLILCAPTGVAAINIGGGTVHQTFGLGVQTERTILLHGRRKAAATAVAPTTPDDKGPHPATAATEEQLIPDAARAKLQRDIAGIINKDAAARLRQAQTVIVDEVSMLQPMTIHAMDVVARAARGRMTEAFGGLQMIFVGDFLQLPPVRDKTAVPIPATTRLPDGSLSPVPHDFPPPLPVKLPESVIKASDDGTASTPSDEGAQAGRSPAPQVPTMPDPAVPTLQPKVKLSYKSAKYVFQTRPWLELNPRVIELREIFRQKEPKLLSLLNDARVGVSSEKQFAPLLKHQHPKDAFVVRIRSTNEEVDYTNSLHYDRLGHDGPEHSYAAFTKGWGKCGGQLCPTLLHLKIGTAVMLLKNIDVGGNLANGSTGVVVDFAPADMDSVAGSYAIRDAAIPIVDFGPRVGRRAIGRAAWQMTCFGKITGSFVQVPLRHAWAITAHKSQGMTLQYVDVDLSRCFEYGQAYVALSRAKQYENLKVTGFSAKKIRACPVAKEFTLGLADAEAATAHRTSTAKESPPPPPPSTTV